MDVTCPCGTTFTAKSPRAKYCSDRCRKRRARGKPAEVVALPTKAPEQPDTTPQRGPVEAAAVKELTEAEKLDTTLGQTIVTLARRLDHPALDTGSAVATVAARLDELLAKATRGVKGAASAPQSLQDELAERRAQHGA